MSGTCGDVGNRDGYMGKIREVLGKYRQALGK
jgi:hypothetical protein